MWRFGFVQQGCDPGEKISGETLGRLTRIATPGRKKGSGKAYSPIDEVGPKAIGSNCVNRKMESSGPDTPPKQENPPKGHLPEGGDPAGFVEISPNTEGPPPFFTVSLGNEKPASKRSSFKGFAFPTERATTARKAPGQSRHRSRKIPRKAIRPSVAARRDSSKSAQTQRGEPPLRVVSLL